MGTSSAACEAFYCADIAVAVDRQQLTIIQQDISLVASVAIEFSNRVALLDQDIRNFLAEVGLARYQAGKVLAALRAVGEAEDTATCILVECGALAVRLMLNNCIRTDGDAGVLRRDPISHKRVFNARGWRDGAGEYQRGTCYDCGIAQDSHRIAGAGPHSHVPRQGLAAARNPLIC